MQEGAVNKVIVCKLRYNIFSVVLIAFATLFLSTQLHAQSGVGSSLEAEIQNAEKASAKQGITPSERHDALVRLARLRQLSGDIEGAAKNWLEAAAAVPGKVDDEALLSCAYCLAAMGEWDRAEKALEPIVSKLPRARFLDLSIKAIRSGDTSNLAAIAEHPNYYEIKSEILFVLWKVSRGNTGERWRQRLVTEFPQTPEGQLAAGHHASSISIRQSPFWLFASGLDSLPLAETKPAGKPAPSTQPAVTAQSAKPAPTVTIAQAIPEEQTLPALKPAVTQSPNAAQQPTSGKLQTGAFSRQENAQTQAEKLKSAGFSPMIERRIVNNSEMWAVVVPAGNNQTQTVNALRAAGFDSFPVK